MSFIPFNYGERKCLGYQFAKVIIPSLVTKMIHGIEYEFADPQLVKEEHHYPIASLDQSRQPPIDVRIKSINY